MRRKYIRWPLRLISLVVVIIAIIAAIKSVAGRGGGITLSIVSSTPSPYSFGYTTTGATSFVALPRRGLKGGSFTNGQEWLKPGQTSKPWTKIEQGHFKVGDLAGYQIKQGEEVYIIAAGLSRGNERGTKERTKATKVRW